MMGVYIKGVEMPKDGEHPYWVTIHSDGIVEYNENKGQGWQTSEAVPVPPHGKLVDADALLKKIRCRSLDEHGEYLLWYVGEDDIKNAPTIIPEEQPKEEEK